MNDEFPDSEFQSRLAASNLLILGAQQSSASLDKFSGWLLAGFGAGFALLLSDVESVSNVLPIANLRCAGMLFLVAALAAVLAKLLASLVGAAAAAGSKGAELGKRLADDDAAIDFHIVLAETEKAFFLPARALVTAALKRAMAGDVAVSGRTCAKASQLQTLLVLGQSLLSLAAALVILYGLAV